MPLEPSISRVSSAADDPTASKPGHNFVTCIHIVKLGDIFCSITVTWAKTLISHTLYITIEDHDDNHHTCKIDLKTWQFWGKKGLKTLRFAGKNVDVFWDLRSAKFSTSPEPSSDYYVAMVSCQEIVLLLGDQKNEALKRTRCRPSLEDACLVQRKEIVFGKKCFCTRSKMGRDKKEHSIMIESCLSGPYEPEMWISVDGRESIRVPNLHWRFRGNETIVVDDFSMQILWDVHDWLYSGTHSGVGIFVCRRGGDFDEGEFNGYHLEVEEFGRGDVQPASMPLCHFIYAWIIE
ncbi:hypothetical protein ACS0TY_016579 [Phlomoides rotata]